MVNKNVKNTSEAYIQKERLQQYLYKHAPKKIAKGTVEKVKDLPNKPDYCRIDEGNTSFAIVVWFENDTIYVWSRAENIYMPFDSSSAFADASELETIDWSLFSFEKVENGNSMFYRCKKLKNCAVNLENAKNLSLCFYDCESLEQIIFDKPINQLCTANSMFEKCESLETIDMSSWKCNSLVTTENMFKDCIKLRKAKMFTSWSKEDCYESIHFQDLITAINFMGFKNQKETDEFTYQITHCNPSTTIDWLEKLDKKPGRNIKLMQEPRFTKVTTRSSLMNCASMFENCTNLEELDISNIQFFTAKVSRMLYHCGKLADHEAFIRQIFELKDRSQYKKLEKSIGEHETDLFM